jgi:hypothetical protein
MTMRRARAVLLLALLGGCATATGGETWVFEKPGMTEAQLRRDREECSAQAIDAEHLHRGGFPFRINRDAYKTCMQQRGYQVRVAMTAEVPSGAR